MFGFMRRNGIMVTIDLAVEIPEDRKCIVCDGESLMWMLYVWSAHWGVGEPGHCRDTWHALATPAAHL